MPSLSTPYSCGRPFPSVDVIEGRKENFIVTPDRRILQLIEDPMNEGRGIAASQFIQDAPDHLTVNILPSPDFDPECLAAVCEGTAAPHRTDDESGLQACRRIGATAG